MLAVDPRTGQGFPGDRNANRGRQPEDKPACRASTASQWSNHANRSFLRALLT